MIETSRIYVAGHTGLVGSALCRALPAAGLASPTVRTHEQLDLRDQAAVDHFFAQERPNYVFLAAATVGGIGANQARPAEFIYDNLAVAANVLNAAYKHKVLKLLFLGSSCIYPREAPQPIREEYLLTGPLEPTNRPYAIAKIAGIELCRAYRRQYGCNFISAMPTNLYGPGDNFDPEGGHVIPAMVCKFHKAKINGEPQVVLWGTGIPRREFLFVDDLAWALITLMQDYNGEEPVNIGTGEDITIADLAMLIAYVVGYDGKIVFDSTKPDGTPRKLLDISRISALHWKPHTSLRDGLRATYKWFLAQSPQL